MHNLASCCLIVVILFTTASVGLAYDGVVDLFRVANSNGYNTADAGVRSLIGITWYPVCGVQLFDVSYRSSICERAGFTSHISRTLRVDLYNATQGVFLGYSYNLASFWYTLAICSSVEKVFCISSDPNTYPVRLSGGRDNSSGRLEININGVWGTVCDDGFGITEATVVCQQLGFKSLGSVYTRYFHSSTTDPILLDDVQCHGGEPHLVACLHARIGTNDCQHREDVHVNCSSQELMLVGGIDERRGRLEIKIENTRGSVCDDGFTLQSASVVCRQLGFTEQPARLLTGTVRSAPNRIWLDEVRCFGNETHLWDCAHSRWGANDCSHSEDVFIECPLADDYDLRLRGGSESANGTSGILEIKLGGTFRPLCGSINQKGAVLACQQMGYPSNMVGIFNRRYILGGNHPCVLYDVNCNALATSFEQCSLRPPSTYNYQTVGIACEKGEMPARLMDGPNANSGRLEVSVGDVWGTVCDDDFDNEAAEVACRQLGLPFTSARVVSSRYGHSSGQIWLDDVQCTGEETNLKFCQHSPIGTSDCTHSEDVSIICSRENNMEMSARLMDGPNANSGRLEVSVGDVWGTVCDDHFDNKAAEVACRQLGLPFTSARVVTSGYGHSSGQIWLDDVQCTGEETNLKFCQHSPIGTSDCTHSEDVSIICSRENNMGMSARLMDGPNANSGRLEVSVGDVWGTVCDDNFDSKAAEVACRQLGLPFTSARVVTSGYGHTSGQIWLDDVQCTGEEADLQLCQHNPIGTNDCTHSEDVAITCAQENNHVGDYLVRLVGGTSTRGRVEVSIGGQWGTVCNDHFDRDAAKVVCRQLGYSGGARVDYSHYPPTTGEILLDDVRCTGGESTLKYCSHNEPGINDCSHSEDVAVNCEDPTGKTGNPMTVVGAVFGSIAGALVIAGLSCYCRSKSLNRRRAARSTRRQARSLSQSLHYTLTVQYNNATGNLQTGSMGPGRVIIPPSSPGIYAGPPSYDQLFPNGETVVSASTGDSSPPPYPGLTTPAVFTVPTDSVATTVSTAPTAPTMEE